ncbi:MAG: hypothetical protein R3F11_09015 [Verrucomicrobiales bacterium]
MTALLISIAWLHVGWIYAYRVRPLAATGTGEDERHSFASCAMTLGLFGFMAIMYAWADCDGYAALFGAGSFACWLGAVWNGRRCRRIRVAMANADPAQAGPSNGGGNV